MALTKKLVIFLLLFSLALALSGCKKAECEFDEECEKPHFDGKCADDKCTFTPKPGECGNTKCEKGENECTCSEDCGSCQGTAGKYLVKSCLNDQCVGDIPSQKQTPTVLTSEATNAGDKIRITTDFPSPFNIKRDVVKFSFFISTKNNFNHVLKSIELSGVADKRPVVLGQKSFNRPIWDVGKENEITEELILDFQTKAMEGEMKDLEVTFVLNYDVKSGTKFFPKTQNVKTKLKDAKFIWVQPSANYSCPDCEQRTGFQTVCGAQTNFFCTYQPTAGACGNNVCDTNENKCTCVGDCGVCQGETIFFEAGCADNKCVYSLKSTVVQESVKKFDDRKLSIFNLQNNYNYMKPFNINTDKFELNFNLVEVASPDVSAIKIETVRLLEGNEEVASASVKKELAKGRPVKVDLRITSLPVKEEEKSLNLRVDYSFTKAGKADLASYTYVLEKLPIINPDA